MPFKDQDDLVVDVSQRREADLSGGGGKCPGIVTIHSMHFEMSEWACTKETCDGFE
jgi:hypothetical protein